MCTIPPVTDKNTTADRDADGTVCPLCAADDPTGEPATAKLGFMRFLDPHGVYRVDAGLLECGARRHSFTKTGAGLRLLAADGRRPASATFFERVVNGWTPV